MNTTTINAKTEIYGYGFTKEAASIVRQELKEQLKSDIKKYGLTIRVRKADSGYGGPRVNITTNQIELDKRYEYIINSEDGQIGNGPGKLESKPVSQFEYGRPSHLARLVTPEALQQLDNRINEALRPFGHDNDDIMTDYHDNTKPLFYGVKYKEV